MQRFRGSSITRFKDSPRRYQICLNSRPYCEKNATLPNASSFSPENLSFSTFLPIFQLSNLTKGKVDYGARLYNLQYPSRGLTVAEGSSLRGQ